MIEESEVEKAIGWMIENSTKAAQARANREYLQEYRKTLKAQLMSLHLDKPLAAQEREAYSDPKYAAHLEVLKDAIETDERFRWLMSAAETKVSAWQSMNRAKGA